MANKNNDTEIKTLYEDNLMLKIEIIEMIDHFIELREKQIKMLDECDVNLQNKVKIIHAKSKM